MQRNFSFIPGERHNYIKQFAGVLHRFGVSENLAYRELMSYESEGFPGIEIEKIIKGMYAKQYV